MNEPLPLYPGSVPCVQCGYCCKVRPCAFGVWDPEKHQCKFLTADNLCGIYKEILALPVELWEQNPAFGAGCCCPLFNTDRENVLKKRKHDSDRKKVD